MKLPKVDNPVSARGFSPDPSGMADEPVSRLLVGFVPDVERARARSIAMAAGFEIALWIDPLGAGPKDSADQQLFAAIELAQRQAYSGLFMFLGQSGFGDDTACWLKHRLMQQDRQLITDVAFKSSLCREQLLAMDQRYQEVHQALLRNIYVPRGNFPKVLALNLFANRCFASCRFCPQHFAPERTQQKVMSDEVFAAIVRDIPNDRGLWVRLGTDGEPLTFPKILDFISVLKAARPGVKTEMATNGILLNEMWFRQLADAGLDHLSISVNAPTREDYRWFVGVDGYDRLAANLEKIPRWRKSGASIPLVSANLVNIQRWQHRLGVSKQWLERLVDRVDVTHVQFIEDPDLVNADDQRAQRVQEIPACTFLESVMTIETDGALTVCCATEFSGNPSPELGRVGTKTLSELWTSSAYLKLREKNLAGQPVLPDCNTCRVNCPDLGYDVLYKQAAMSIQHERSG
ncbi:MAG: radical SAM/SPASM domain-containing protein [Lysobacterales bacterium]